MIHVGTSGFSYPEWRGTFYPERFPAARMLPYYAERFHTVELNNTFYRMPTREGDRRLGPGDAGGLRLRAQGVPSASPTSPACGTSPSPSATSWTRSAALGAKLGPLLFQLPPNFRKDPGRLGACLALVPPAVRVAFEFRHASWFDEEVYGILRTRNAALCVADTEAGTTPLVVTADFGYLRLRDREYTLAELLAWAADRRAGRVAGRFRLLQARGVRDRSGAGARARPAPRPRASS